jgi:predicted NBD/HSP70 family sugar kinase
MHPADRIASLAATPSLLRRLNERTVLDRIRVGAPISRADVARDAGLSKPTVSLALQSLLEAGLVREVGVATGGPGRSAVLYEPNHGAAFALGLEIGGGRVRAAITDLGGGFLARREVAAPSRRDAIVSLARALADEHAGGRLQAIVLAVSGVVDPASPQTELGDGLQRALDVPLTVESDVNLAVLGERFAGVSRGASDVAFLSVGVGIAAGLVLDGELHRGRRGAAGALGSLPLADDATDDVERIALCIASIAAVVDVAQVVLGGDAVAAGGASLLAAVRARVGRLVPSPPAIELTALGGDATLTGALALGAAHALDRAFESKAMRARSGV